MTIPPSTWLRAVFGFSTRPVTDNLGDYAVPVHADAPPTEVILIDRPDPHINTLGCRGIGEISITGAAAAVANAVYHATGKRIRALPITPDKLLPQETA
jgi:xanthine dehydrogenase YagR molybdenum-binding subunit